MKVSKKIIAGTLTTGLILSSYSVAIPVQNNQLPVIQSNIAQAATVSSLADRLTDIYDLMDTQQKQDVAKARQALNALTDDEWEDIIGKTLKSTMDTKLTGTGYDSINIVRDVAAIIYDEKGNFQSNIDAFRTKHADSFDALFGSDITVDDMLDFIADYEENITDLDNVLNMVLEGSSIETIAKDVAEDTIAEHPELDNALSSNLSIGIDDLLAIKDRLNPKVDPGSKARNALVSAVLESIQAESPADSGGSAGGGGGGGGAISQPSTDVNVSDNATGVTVKPEITKSQDATTGQTVAKATIDEDSVLKALETSTKTVNVQIDVAEDADTAVAELGANFVTKLTENNQENAITINSKQGSTSIPVKELNNVLQSFKNAGEDISNAKVSVSFGKAIQAEQASIEGAVVNEGAKALTPAFVMNATVTVGGKVHQVKNFSSYVQSTITLEQTVNPKRVVGLQLVSNNEAVAAKAKVRASSLQGEVVAVPTLIQTKDGKSTIIVKQRSSAPVMIVENVKTFSDVPNTFWAKNDIDLLASKMLVKGRETAKFAPQGKVTRAEFATMLVRALGLTAEKTYDFKDVQTDAWYAGTVGAAYKAGIVSGMGEQTFKPNEKITRQQAAAMLINAMEFLGKDIDLTEVEVTEQNARFNDASQVQAWAKDSVVKSAKVGIFGGDEKNKFNPQADTTRAESAAILKRLMKEMELISE